MARVSFIVSLIALFASGLIFFQSAGIESRVQSDFESLQKQLSSIDALHKGVSETANTMDSLQHKLDQLEAQLLSYRQTRESSVPESRPLIIVVNEKGEPVQPDAEQAEVIEQVVEPLLQTEYKQPGDPIAAAEPSRKTIDLNSAPQDQNSIPANMVLAASHSVLKSLEAEEEEFEPLFDEMNDTHSGGWVIQGLEDAGPKVLPDGILLVNGWDYWAIISKKSFGDFILRFDARFEERGNSGILIHTPETEVFKSESRLEIQLDSVRSETLTVKSNGALERFQPPLEDAAGPVGVWDSYEIIYDDRRITVTINGVVVQNQVDLSQFDDLAGRDAFGRIAIQRNDYKKGVYFKNLRIKRLN